MSTSSWDMARDFVTDISDNIAYLSRKGRLDIWLSVADRVSAEVEVLCEELEEKA